MHIMHIMQIMHIMHIMHIMQIVHNGGLWSDLGPMKIRWYGGMVRFGQLDYLSQSYDKAI